MLATPLKSRYTRYTGKNGSVDYCKTPTGRPPAFFDHTTSQ
jgi:hypothetical protein